MRGLDVIMRELIGLFVDDGALVVLTLVWLAVSWWVLPLLAGPVACAVLLFAGLAAALGFSVLRA